MSIKVMSAVFELEGMSPTHKLILLCLADHADDAGRCYPSVSRLVKKSGLSERAVRKNVRELEAAGLLRIEENAGPKGCNVYHVTPAPRAPLHEMPPAPDAPPPCTTCTPTPAPRAPEPSVTINQPSLLAQPEADASATIDRSRFADFWAMVPRKIGKKATEAAWKRLSRADQDAAKDSVAAWYRWFQSTHRDATPLYPERYLKHRRWEDEGWQDKPKAAPDREAAIAMHLKALTSPSEAVRRNAQDQLRKLGETI